MIQRERGPRTLLGADKRNARSRSIRVSSAYVRSVTATRVLREYRGRGRDKGADREGKRERAEGKNDEIKGGDHGD